MNSDWWDLRLRFQGIIPPLSRTETHFDAASKRHIPADIPYIRYYVALLLEFQIHEAMCDAAGHNGPLHTCDVYRSREAGRVLIDILKVGKARHWRDVIRMLTKGNYNHISADAMLEYFEPLLLWLKGQNRGERVIGWTAYKEDTALFQPLIYGSSCRFFSDFSALLLVIIVNWII
ncbi:hypothetical protein NQ314_003584 [Rhamnusium bicolor]|uniref:Angiotensin-converting enzyme n=1 Tax=Rhamnusium bicolor TaxID=1586634 RepID=A0AAV8ZNS4_9CUCU|nr:hypothetical protein NQ314_003584 [Rhamnusium bicolor]